MDLVNKDEQKGMVLHFQSSEVEDLDAALRTASHILQPMDIGKRIEQLLVDLEFAQGKRKNNAPGMPAWASTSDR